jgi:hypothetical protein
MYPLPNPQTSRGNLLGVLTAAFYVLFTLLPDSNSVMVSWPWVFIWQVGLLCPVLWLLGRVWQRQGCWLGNHLDWVVGLLITGTLVSSSMASFPMQARWYGWAVFCFLAALYALHSWLNCHVYGASPQENRGASSQANRRIWLLTLQGYLNLGFILLSLVLWSSQTWMPALSQLRELQQFGVNLTFDFADIELRNWAPIGHQNYVAGYLVLALPLLCGLGLVQKGWRRWIWIVGAVLGLLDLYTTSSRAGWLGVLVLAIAGFLALLWRSSLPKLWLGVSGLAGLTLLLLLALSNNRIWAVVTQLGQGGGELAYRLITITTGWQMGLSRPFTGIGLGGVPLFYQQYRPAWAGREAELTYQLHSTPAHLWAELGLWAVVTVVGAIALLTLLLIHWLRRLAASKESSSATQSPPVLIGSLFAGLLAYGVFSLFDYQMDNPCISGTLVIYLAVLAAEGKAEGKAKGKRQKAEGGRREDGEWRAESGERGAENAERKMESKISPTTPPTSPSSPSPPLFPSSPLPLPSSPRPHPPSPISLAGLGIVLVAVFWLVPVHRAWMLSSQGFAALSQKDVNTFVQRLEQAHRLAPWEPYYPYQLGWNLGDLGLQTRDSGLQTQLFQDSITWLQRGIQASPYQEFGYTNLAWLLLNREPRAASQAFIRSAQLVPAKRGVLYGLGLSLLAQSKTDLAIAALTLEGLRDPVLLTSPVWRSPDLQPLYSPVVKRIDAEYTALLGSVDDTSDLAQQLHRSRGGLRWWIGDLAGARTDLEQSGTPTERLILDLAAGKAVQAQVIEQIPATGKFTRDTAGLLAIAAWLDPDRRTTLLRQAWIASRRTAPTAETLQQLVDSMNRSTTFDQWLKQNAPSQQYRRFRAGFGVLSRHIDGPLPADFPTVVENIPITTFFETLVPSPMYAPALDAALQEKRQGLLERAKG